MSGEAQLLSGFAGALKRGIGRLARRAPAPDRPGFPDFPPLGERDRLLVLAPHEDDESLGTGGLIQHAVARGIPVRVVYLTNGDHNELAFMIYRRSPEVSPAINREMGEVRRREAVEAMTLLGVQEKNLFFLGFPDNGTLAIWKEHWGASPPLHSLLTDTRRVPYRRALCYGKPYKGEEIAKAVELQLLDFRPTRVFVPHPLDGNPDHRAYCLFLQLALLTLGGRIDTPRVFTYPVHMGPWPRPHRFHPDDWLAFPARLAGWEKISFMEELSPAQVERKHRAIALYRSQMSDCAYWLTAFARRNELFTELKPPEAAAGRSRQAVASAATDAYEEEMHRGHLKGVAYRPDGSGLVIGVDLRRPCAGVLGVSLHAFGFRNGTPFGAMPKLHLEWVMDTLHVRDRGRRIDPEGVTVEKRRSSISFTLPWEMLGKPDAVFLHARGTTGEVARSLTGWEVAVRGGDGCAGRVDVTRGS